MTRLVIADDHAIVRRGLRSLIEQAGGHDILAECTDAESTREAVRRFRPEVLVLDIAMPGDSGLDLARELRGSHPELRILLYSQYTGPMYVAEARRLGLAGYVSKDAVADELLEALHAIAAGQFYLSHDLRGQDDVSGLAQLSEREREVLLLLAHGCTPKQTAFKLEISEKTVYTHRERIREKLGVQTDQQLMKLAQGLGLLR